jgi:hypothetical protein
MVAIRKFRLNEKQYQELREQLEKLQEMENCLNDWSIACYELLRIPIDEKTEIFYWVNIIKYSDEEDYIVEIEEEEQYS